MIPRSAANRQVPAGEWESWGPWRADHGETSHGLQANLEKSFICIVILIDSAQEELYESIMRHSNSQQMVLGFIEQYQGENQRPPTIREIQDYCGFKSPRAVSYILEK